MKLFFAFLAEQPMSFLLMKREWVYFILRFKLAGFVLLFLAPLSFFYFFHEKANRKKVLEERTMQSASLLTAHIRLELEALKFSIVHFGSTQSIRSSLDLGRGESSSPCQLMPIPEPFLDLELWKMDENSNLVPTYLKVQEDFSKQEAQEWLDQIHAIELEEKNFLNEQEPFQIKLSSLTHPKTGNIGWMAIQLESGSQPRWLAGHLNLKFFQELLEQDPLVLTVLLDSKHKILAQSNHFSHMIDESRLSDLLTKIKVGALDKRRSAELHDLGKDFFTAIEPLASGSLAVIGLVNQNAPELLTTQVSLIQILAYFCSCILICLAVTRRQFQQDSEKIEEKKGDPEGEDLSSQDILVNLEPVFQKQNQTLVVGKILDITDLIEKNSSLDLANAVHDFLKIFQSVVKHFKGEVFLLPGGACVASFDQTHEAVKAIYEIKKEFYRTNQAFELDGKKKLNFVMGAHAGEVIRFERASFGPNSFLLGENFSCAKSLMKIAIQSKVDLLISQALWTPEASQWVGQLVGEAKLSSKTGLMNIYRIFGIRNDQGQELILENEFKEIDKTQENQQQQPMPIEQQMTQSNFIFQPILETRWLVNNGSQMLGPLTAAEVAQKLFAQEIDFDAQCWSEGTGLSFKIANSKMFSGSDDPGANLWIFDGKMIHGPMHAAFLKTAVLHEVFETLSQVFVCKGSTLNGWKSLEKFQELFQ